MHTLPQISQALRSARARLALSQADLRTAAGVSRRTLTKVLGGQDDFRVSTLLAIADRLGLELLLVPKGAAQAVTAGDVAPLAVKTRVGAVLERLGGSERDER